MSRAFDVSYVCHRAANAIVTQVDPLRVSSDALQIINQFLDEFITLLLASAKSLDLSRIKAAVVTLLPSSLGKNAIVEAELQVKSYTETADDIDYEAYERTRRLDSIPLDSIGAILRQECIQHCTLAETNHQHQDDHQNSRRPSISVPKTHSFAISPIVTVYVTSIIEHVAEYVLIAAATTAESQDSEYIRIKEVFAALSEDVQIASMFCQMELRDRLKNRASFVMGYHHKMRHQQQLQSPWSESAITSASRKPHRESSSSSGRPVDPYADVPNLDNDSSSSSHNNDIDLPCSPTATGSGQRQHQHQHQQRPMSIMSTSTSTNTISSTNSSGSNGTSSKKRFPRLFKRRDSTQQHHRISTTSTTSNSKPMAISVYNPDSPTMVDFEDLIKSGDTVRMSLTPNRLKSIEVNSIVDGATDSTSIASSKRSSVPSASPSVNHAGYAFENPRAAPKPPAPPPRRRKSVERPATTPPPPAPPPLNPARRSRPQTVLERPSSMVAKRQTMILNNGGSAQEGYFTLAAAGTMTASTGTVSPDAAAADSNKNTVKEKVLKFERHQRVPKRDAYVQTEAIDLPPPPPPPPPPRRQQQQQHQQSKMDPTLLLRSSVAEDSASESGIVDGDEEWFVSEDEFEDEQTVVEWLLAAG